MIKIITSRVVGQAREGADGLALEHPAQRNRLSVATTCAVNDAITGLASPERGYQRHDLRRACPGVPRPARP